MTLEEFFKNLNPKIQKVLNKSFFIYRQLCDKEITSVKYSPIVLSDFEVKCCAIFISLKLINFDDLFEVYEIELKDILDTLKIFRDREPDLTSMSHYELLPLELNLDEDNIEVTREFLEKFSHDFLDSLNITENDSLYDFIYKVSSVCNYLRFIVKEKEFNLGQVFNSYINKSKISQENEINIKEILEEMGIPFNEQRDNIHFIEIGKPVSFNNSPLEIPNSSCIDEMMGIESNFLEKKGTILTDEDYKFDPAIGREEIIKKIAITLETPTKSVILIGQPGVGKTAVVKGLAKAAQDGKYLQGREIIEINASSLIAGKSLVGSMEGNIEKLIDSIEKRGNVILFIDEIHQIYNMGMGNSEVNVMNMFKKPIEKGILKLIGSTTKEEYDETIRLDSAFSDRFDTFFIPELDDKKIKQIVLDRIQYLENYYKILLPFDNEKREKFSKYLVELTRKENRKTNQMCYNPRLVIQLIDTIFSSAYVNKNLNIEKEDILYGIKNSSKLKRGNYLLPDFWENESENKNVKKLINFSDYKRKK